MIRSRIRIKSSPGTRLKGAAGGNQGENTEKSIIKKLSLAATLLAGMTVFSNSHAVFITGPVSSNAYISMGGLDWAWAYPLPGSHINFEITAEQAAFGWRLPTLVELGSAPLATDFLFPGGNVPFGGSDPVSGATFSATNAAYNGDGACATPWFSNQYRHCDWVDGLGQPLGPWAGMSGAPSFAEQLVVRRTPGAVPEPATMALLGLGLAGFGAARRRA